MNQGCNVPGFSDGMAVASARPNWRMYFKSNLGVCTYLKARFSGKQVFYNQKTLFVYLLEKWLFRNPYGKKMFLGQVEYPGTAQQEAYSHARACVATDRYQDWTQQVGHDLEMNFQLIFEKYMFEVHYEDQLFANLAKHYVVEKKIHAARVVTNSAKWRSSGLFDYLLLPLRLFCLLPKLLLIVAKHARRSKRTAPETVHGKKILRVDSKARFDMLSEVLLPDADETLWVVEPADFVDVRSQLGEKIDLHELGLSQSDTFFFTKYCFRFFGHCIRYLPILVCLVPLVPGMFEALVRGAALAVRGSQNIFVNGGHLFIERAVCNEIIRAGKSKTVFMQPNVYVTHIQYPAEWKLNYDVLFSTGPHMDELYAHKEMRTTKSYSVGAYDVLRPIRHDGFDENLSELEVFKNGQKLILVTSSGLSDATYIHEKKLVDLTCELAKLDGVKVIMRVKPYIFEDEATVAQYKNWLGDAVDHVWLTGGEFKLTDFLPVADLVVTSISTSAHDLAARGADVAFVDFLDSPDMYLPGTRFPHTVVNSKDAVQEIADYLQQGMGERLKPCGEAYQNYLSYPFDSFEAYAENARQCLRREMEDMQDGAY